MSYRLIVAGGRGFNNYQLLRETIDTNFDWLSLEIVCGMARGADKLGLRYAEDRGLPVAKFPAEWDKFGKSAGYRRNAEMANYADGLLAFWDGESRGTKHMIDLATKAGIRVEVVMYDK